MEIRDFSQERVNAGHSEKQIKEMVTSAMNSAGEFQRIYYDAPNPVNQFKTACINVIKKAGLKKCYDGIVVLCIGSAFKKHIGDNLGPLTGSLLKQQACVDGVYIYGDMAKPLEGRKNLFDLTFENKIRPIAKRHPNALTIAIDAGSTSNKYLEGAIEIEEGSKVAGSGFGLQEPAINGLWVVGVTTVIKNNGTYKEHEEASEKIDKNLVKGMSQVIALGLYETLKTVKEQGFVLLSKENLPIRKSLFNPFKNR